MKKQSVIIIALLFVLGTTQIRCDVVMDALKGTGLLKTKSKEKPQFISLGVIGALEPKLSSFKKEKKKLDEGTKEFSDDIKKKIAETTQAINEVNAQIARGSGDTEFLNRKLTLLNEIYAVLNDIKSVRNQLIDIIEQNIKIVEEYLKDPSLNGYRKEYRDPKKLYSFNNFLNLHQHIIDQEKRIESLEEQQRNVKVERENREQSAIENKEAYRKKKKALEDFIKSPETSPTPDFMFEFDQQKKLKLQLDLLTLQEKFLKAKNQLNEYRLKEAEYKSDLIENKIFLEKKKLHILKEALIDIKTKMIPISESDINADRAKLEQKRRESLASVRALSDKIDFIEQENDKKIKQLENYSTQYDIPIDIQLNQWEIIPKTIDDYTKILKTGSLNEYIKRNEREKDILQAQMAKESAKREKEAKQIDAKETFYKIKRKKFTTEDEINKEIGKYTKYLSDITTQIIKYKNQKKVAQDHLTIKRRALENIHVIRSNLIKDRAQIKPTSYNLFINLLKNAEAMIVHQIKILQNIISIYDSVIDTQETAYKHIIIIKTELESASMWFRPAYALTWEDFKSVFPELQKFFNDLKAYVFQLRFVSLIEKMRLSFPNMLDIVVFFLKLIIILLLLLLFRIYAPSLYRILISAAREYKGIRFFSLLAAFILEFIVKYFGLIFIWIILFVIIQLGGIPDNHMHILFYLLSIPYLLYLANRFLYNLSTFNARNEYALFSRSFQKRLMITLSIILYATIIIFLFRKAFTLGAFILGTYYKSELPSIMLALYIIIIQVSVLPLLVKEAILHLIPTKNRTWRWVHAQVNKFYYLILALIIVMIILSNPYIGFTKLVGYVTVRIFITGLLIAFLFWLHGVIKRVSLKLFFTTEEEVVQARFTYGKTTYGLFVIFSFIFLIGIGILIGAYIWGWDISLSEIYQDWCKYQVTIAGSPTTIIKLFTIPLYIFAGFICAYLINRFVLKKIFDLLLVNTGVQNAVTSIMKYIIVIAFFMIGLFNVNLGTAALVVLAPLVLSMSLILKDPITDFVYYFIILVQRPLKIGDYILLDNEVQGVVRKITPRSVVVRKKNSETILVPNSKILTNPIFNWNYVSGFVAFNDILLTIAYKEDPERVKTIFLEVLDRHPNVLKSPRPVVRLENFGEYGYVFLIRGFLSSHYTLDKWDIASDIRLSLVKALRENNIEIAVPVRMMLPTKTAIPDSKKE